MKKCLVLLSMTLLIGTQTGSAEMWGLFQNFSADGSLEAAGQQANNESDVNNGINDHRGAVNTRVRIGVNGDITEGVRSRIELVRTSLTTGAGGGVTPNQAGSGVDTIAAEANIISVDNAYVDFNDFLWIDQIRAGRQFVGRPGDLLVFAGPYNDDNLSVTFLDALALWKKVGKVNLTGVTGKPREGHAVALTDRTGTGDINVSWLTAQSSELIPNIPLEVGYYQGTNSNGPLAADNNTLTIMDFRGGLSLMENALNLALEYARNGGQANFVGGKVKHKGSAIALSGAYDNSNNGLGLHAKYVMASGDKNLTDTKDKAFRDFRNIGFAVSDFRYGEILSNSNAFAVGTGMPGAGLDTGAAGTGLNIINLGGYFVVPPAPKVTLMADYYMVKANKTTAGFSKSIGNEIDLSLAYDHSSNIRLALGYAMLNAGKGLGQLIGGVGSNISDSVDKFFARIAIKFGPASAPAMTEMRRPTAPPSTNPKPAQIAPAPKKPAR